MTKLHKLVRASAAAMALLIAAQAHAQPAPQVAGVAADMTLDAARTSAPAVQWQNELSRQTGKPIGIWADAAFTVEGQPYRVSLEPKRSGSAFLKLVSDVQVPKAKLCRARVVALAAHFDTFFTEMKPELSPLDRPRSAGARITYNRLPGGAGYVSATPNVVDDGRDYDTLEAGRNAKIQQIEYDGTDDVDWMTGQRAKDDYHYALDLKGSFYSGNDALPAVCHIDATVTRYPMDRQWPGRSSFEMLDTAKTKLVHRPSIADLHNSLEGAELPPEGMSLAYRCEVSRTNGHVMYCEPHERQPASTAMERAAGARMSAMAFDPANLDPDNDLRLKADITVKLLPSERLAGEALKKLPKPPPAAVNAPLKLPNPAPAPTWTRTPTGSELSSLYPQEALQKNIQARVVATCRIADDLSLACFEYKINPPEHVMFEAAAKKILALYRAAPQLRDGSNAINAVVHVPIRFQLEDDEPLYLPSPPPRP